MPRVNDAVASPRIQRGRGETDTRAHPIYCVQREFSESDFETEISVKWSRV